MHSKWNVWYCPIVCNAFADAAIVPETIELDVRISSVMQKSKYESLNSRTSSVTERSFKVVSFELLSLPHSQAVSCALS